MANEDPAQGIDGILADIPDEEPQQVEEVAAEQPAAEPATEPAAEQPAAEEPAATQEEVEAAESQVAKLFPKMTEVDHTGGTVPVDKHIALRKRAQAAEARAAALEAKQANVNVDALSDLAALVEDSEEEYVDKETLKKVVSNLPDAINNIAQQTVNQTLQNVNTTHIQNKAASDEIVARKAHTDYDAVTEYVTSRNLLTDADRQTIFQSPNIAEAYYEIATAKINQEKQILGVAQPQTPSQPTNNDQPTGQDPSLTGDDEPLDDEAAFDVFKSIGKGS